VEEIFKLVDEELKKVNRSKILPVGIFLSGGGSLLKNISKTAKKILSLPVAFLEPKYIKIEVDKANRPDFLTALSLAVFGCYSSFSHKGNSMIKDNFKDLFGKAQSFFKKIMPK
jgi:cell division ATPase FtsA